MYCSLKAPKDNVFPQDIFCPLMIMLDNRLFFQDN